MSCLPAILLFFLVLFLCFSTPPFLAAASIFLFFQSFKPCARWRRSQEGTKGIARQRKLYKHTDRPRSQSISIQEPQEARAIAQFSLIVCRNIQICAPVPALSFFNFKISQTKFAPVLGIMSLYSFWCVFFFVGKRHQLWIVIPAGVRGRT